MQQKEIFYIFSRAFICIYTTQKKRNNTRDIPLELPSHIPHSKWNRLPPATEWLGPFFFPSFTIVATKQYFLSFPFSLSLSLSFYFFIRVCVNGKFENLWVYRMCTSLFFIMSASSKQVRMSEMVVVVCETDKKTNSLLPSSFSFSMYFVDGYFKIFLLLCLEYTTKFKKILSYKAILSCMCVNINKFGRKCFLLVKTVNVFQCIGVETIIVYMLQSINFHS